MESTYLTPELQQRFPYVSKGKAAIKSVVSEEKDKFLATASLAALEKYIPDIDTAKNVDLLGIAFNIFVANRVNKNDDVSDSATSVALAKLFLNKPINVEHKRDRVVGVVLNSAFTKFGSNEPMTEEEALASTDPFNVTLGGIVWRIVNPKLAKYIEECSDPSSEEYEKVSASWEVGFLDFAIAAIDGDSRNLADAEIITSQDEIKALKGYMKAFEGKGFKGDKKLYRLIQGEALPLGTGLTTAPASEVKGIATNLSTQEEEKEKKEETKAEATPEKPSQNESQTTTTTDKLEQVDAQFKELTREINQKSDKVTKNISQNKENVVIQERKAIAMKITKLGDITDDFLKEAKASEISEFVQEQFKAAEQNYQAEKSKLENEVKASKEAAEKLTADATKMQEEIKKLNESVASLQAEKEARAKQDAFNVRMASLDSEFELADAEREVIASDISNLDDTGFDAYKKKLDVLLAAKKKSAKKTCAKEAKASEEKKEEKQEAKASTEEKKETVENAVENAKSKEQLAAAASAQEPSMLDKFSKAFGVDQWISDIKLAE